MKILITGGLGYIGSHVTVELLKKNHQVLIIDNLSNSDFSVLNQIKKITKITPDFEKVDLVNRNDTSSFFNRHKDIDSVIHFAALKSVNESVQFPLKYYENNVLGTINLLEFMPNGIPFVFSSSCTVYGNSDVQPMSEYLPFKNPSSPYGHTKQICEQIINAQFKIELKFKGISLRYFNPIGAHTSGLIGENPKNNPENILPYLTQVVNGKQDFLTVYGNDYPTKDGSCIRDYIHIMDLTEAHCKAIEYLKDLQTNKYLESINIGTGRGVSVFELISEFEKITGKIVEFEVGNRRSGDVVIAYADNKKAKKILGWKSNYSLSEALKSAWDWEKIRNVYN
jgi:UDP-glucose 4-epimerase